MNAAQYLAAAAAAGWLAAGMALAGTVSVTGPAKATPGGTVTVSVTLSSDLNNVYALQSALSYDPAVLTPLPSQEASAAQGRWAGALDPFPGESIPKDADLFRMNASQAGVIIFGYVKNPSSPAGSPSSVVPPTALSLNFSVSTAAQGTTMVQLSPYTVNGQTMPDLILGGSDGTPMSAAVGAPLGISLRLPGDANGDGVISMEDVAIAMQLAGGLLSSAAASTPGADVWPVGTPDGSVSVQDATRILRFLNGLDTNLN